MPILSRAEYEQRAGRPINQTSDAGMTFAEDVDKVVEEPTWGETFGANMRVNNPLGTFIADSLSLPPEKPVGRDTQYFDPFLNIPEGIKGTEKEADYLDTATSADRQSWWVNNWEREKKDRATLEQSGLAANLATGLPVALLDPLTWPTMVLPGAVILNTARFANMGVKTALATEAAVTAASVGASELLLHGQQQERTVEESVYAIGGSVALTGIISGLAMGLKHSNAVAKQLDSDMKGDANPMISKVAPDEGMSVGAAESVDQLPAKLETKLRNEYQAKVDEGKMTREAADEAMDLQRNVLRDQMSAVKHPKLYRALGWIHPSVRTATSASNRVRTLGAQLVNDTLQRIGGKYGVSPGHSVEAMRDMDIATIAVNKRKILNNGYVSYKTGNVEKVQLTKVEFSAEVSRALNHLDSHEIPAVQAAARAVRSELIQPMEDRMLAIGLLDKEYVGLENVTREDYESLYMGADGVVYSEAAVTANKIFDSEGNIRANRISGLDKDARQLLEDKGVLTSRAKLPKGDESYLHRVWDKDMVDNNRIEFEDYVANLFREKGLQAIDDKLEAAQTKVDDLLAESEVEAAGIPPEKSTFTVDKNTIIGKKQATITNAKRRLTTLENKLLELTKAPTINKKYMDDVEALRNQIDDYEAKIIAHYVDLVEIRAGKMPAEMKIAHAKWLQERVVRVADTDRKLIDAQVASAARQVRKNIMNDEYNITNAQRTFEAGPLKARAIDLSFDDVEKWLVRDLDEIMDSYSLHVAPQLAIGEKFEFTGKDMGLQITNLINDTLDDFDVQIRNATPGADRVKLQKDRNQAKEDLTAMFEQLVNKYKSPDNPDNIFRQLAEDLRAFNFVTRLGLMTISAIPDIGHMIMRRGLAPIAESFTQLINPGELGKIARENMADMAVQVDLANNGRARSLSLNENPSQYGKRTKWKAVRNKAVDGFSLFTGMPHWNAALKSVVGGTYSSEIIRQAGKALDGELSESTIARFAQGGLSEDTLKAIGREARNGGSQKIQGAVLANPNVWKDQLLARKFKMAVFQETEKTIVTPGIGDLPLAMRGPLGQFVLQFKGFAITSNNRVLLASIDDWTYNRAMGAMAMVGLGYASYALRQTLKGQEVSTDFETAFKEGFDRSGFAAVGGEVNGMLEKLTRGEASAYKLAGIEGKPLSRFASRNVVGTLFGVSSGTIADMAAITGAAATGDWNESDYRAARRTVPFNNHAALYRAFTAGEVAVGGKK